MLHMHIKVFLSFCVNPDSLAVDMLSQGCGDGAAVEIWRREESQMLVSFLFFRQFNVERAIKYTQGGNVQAKQVADLVVH